MVSVLTVCFSIFQTFLNSACEILILKILGLNKLKDKMLCWMIKMKIKDVKNFIQIFSVICTSFN